MELEFERHTIDLDSVPPVVAKKWMRAEILAEGFLPFPKRLLRVLHLLFGRGLDLASLQLLLAVVEFRRLKQTRAPSLDYLAFLAGRTQADCQQALNCLKNQGMINVTERNGRLNIDTSPFEDLILSLCSVDQNSTGVGTAQGGA